MRQLFPWILLAVIASGCDCGGQTQSQWGELTIAEETGPEAGAGGTLSVDFGGVQIGSDTARALVLRNKGAAPVTVRRIEVLSGNVASRTESSAAFVLALGDGETLQPAETRSVQLHFRPRAAELGSDVPFSAEVRLHVDGMEETESAIGLALTGTGLGEDCHVTSPLDFGYVWPGESFDVPLHIANLTNEGRIASVGLIEGPDAFAFAFAEGSPGDLQLGPGESRDWTLRFAPSAVRIHEARIRVRRSERCEPQEVLLRGEGIDAAVRWTPAVVDCGHVPVGLYRDVSLQLVNVGHEDATVTLLPITAGPFALVDPPPKLSLGKKGGSGVVVVRCTPQEKILYQGVLSFQTSLARQPRSEVPLRLVGGGPDISVSPASVDFGEVAYVAGAIPPVIQRRIVTVANVGDPVLDSSGNLRLGKPDTNGVYRPPYLFVRSTGGNTPNPEFAAEVGSTYHEADGLEPPGGRSTVPVTVTLTPSSAGIKAAELVIYSNDLDEPEVVVPLAAEAKVFPECNYAVSTSQLSFGIVSDPGQVTLSFWVRNLGTAPGDVCILSGVALTAGSDPAFTVSDAPVSRKLLPGEVQYVSVTYRPPVNPGSTTLWRSDGEVELFLSSQARPRSTVKLQGFSGAQCLTIIPRELDFGDVKIGCASQQKWAAVYNACTFDVELRGYSVEYGAPLGGNDAFRIVSGPATDGGMNLPAESGPYQFSIEFEPLEATPAKGHVRFEVTQNSQQHRYVLPLRGSGVTSATRDDVYQQDATPQLDLVLSYTTNGGGMDPEFQWIPQNVEALLDDLLAKGIDFHIGINYQEAGSPASYPGVGGRFLADAGTPPVLTPTTPGLKQLFLSRIWNDASFSWGGWCFEAVYEAVTPLVLTYFNTGFLRDDAAFAGLCFGDMYDGWSFNQGALMKAYAKLISVKGFDRADQVRFMAAAPASLYGTIGCHNPHYANNNHRYDQMAALTGGATTEICQEDWYSALAESLSAAAGYRTEFPVTAEPDTSLGPLEVLVNGTTVSSTDATGNVVWTFDPAKSAVVFTDGNVPSPGAEVRIRYSPACF